MQIKKYLKANWY